MKTEERKEVEKRVYMKTKRGLKVLCSGVSGCIRLVSILYSFKRRSSNSCSRVGDRSF